MILSKIPNSFLLRNVSIAALFASTLSACITDENPNDEEYRLDEINFSHYESDTEIVRPESGIIVDNYLYVVLQKFSNEWTPEPGIIAVIDTTTNEEVDTDETIEGIQPIYLDVSNPSEIIYQPELEKLFIQASGNVFQAEDVRYSAGGIVTIDVNTFETELLIDDSSETLNIYNMAIVSDELGYYVGYAGWEDNSIFEFNPTTGSVANISALNNKNISDIEIDKNEKLWVAITDVDDSGIYIVDTTTNEIDGEIIPTILPPQNITFISISPIETTEESESLAIISTYNFGDGGEHVTISVDEKRTLSDPLVETLSTDFRFVSYEDYFFKLDISIDSIQRFSNLTPETVVDEQSILGDDVSANPHDMVFVSNTKAYILRYDARNIWIVNPAIGE